MDHPSPVPMDSDSMLQQDYVINAENPATIGEASPMDLASSAEPVSSCAQPAKKRKTIECSTVEVSENENEKEVQKDQTPKRKKARKQSQPKKFRLNTSQVYIPSKRQSLCVMCVFDACTEQLYDRVFYSAKHDK